MADEKLKIVLPEVFDEKQAKELKSSFSNMLHEYFKAFEEMAETINKNHRAYRFGTAIQFENCDFVFEILFIKNLKGSKIVTGIIEQQSGCINNVLTYEQAQIINKYAFEMAMQIRAQKVEVSKNGFTELKTIDGVYSSPTVGKTPIYRSFDSKINFPEGNDNIAFVKHKGR